ncbi:glycoside hydrolase family protein [Niabella ginsengisoli]|uniref:Glycoside hydrolase family protein n=1 Tax=Niabella ginsengisoli TaxID=522298 RepID=A0ABS9SF77_9BACT|nr:glycoside hydrolase family protein [Niabella ginsengisoli]MCH5597016.1 glycoside hydrolase family protein [Niabella ginsengisoli]
MFIPYSLLQFPGTSFSTGQPRSVKKIGKIDSTNIFISKNYYTWGASVVEGEDGKYHMFYSRWPHGKRLEKDDSLNYIFDGFAGWNKYSEIAYAVSDNITGPYRHVKTILKGTGDPSRWDRFTFHNPYIRKFEGYYYLYFISNSFDSSLTGDKPLSPSRLQWFKYNCTQKIGVLKAKTIEELIDRSPTSATGAFIMEPDNKQTFEVTNNPCVTEGPDGKYYMMYKSRKPVFGHMTFWMAIAAKPEGPFKTVSSVLTSPETASEDPSIWYDKKRKRFYAVAKYFSNTLKLAPQFGSIILITSKNGIDWQPAKHTLATLKEIKFQNGSKVDLANLERPFVVADRKGQPIALFAAAAIQNPFKGNPLRVDNEHNTFNVHIPLK